MKQYLNLILLAIFCFFIEFQIADSIDPRWRRAEVIISGFKDTERLGYGLPRFIELTVNDRRKFSRRMKSTPDDSNVDDDFVVQFVVNDYNSSIETGSLMVPDPLLTPSIFTESTKLTFYAYYTDTDSTNQTIVYDTLYQDIRCAANADRLITKIELSSTISFDLYVSFRCHGYHGLGCRFLCDVGDDVPYECFYDNNDKVCKDRRFVNPPFCNRVSHTCSPNPCLNGGVCQLLTTDLFRCNCRPGYRGAYCSEPYCSIECDYDHGDCAGGNRCQCDEGYTGPTCSQATCNTTINFCRNGGTCREMGDMHVCDCDPKKFAGLTCDLECNPPCVYGNCVEFGNTAGCHCFEGFKGDFCDRGVDISALNIVSKDTKNTVYAIFSGIIIISTLIVFIIGYRIRLSKIYNMRGGSKEQDVGIKGGYNTRETKTYLIKSTITTIIAEDH